MLPDDYLRKLKQDLAEADQLADSAAHYEPDPDAPPPAADDAKPWPSD